jgi:hypothetical protein
MEHQQGIIGTQLEKLQGSVGTLQQNEARNEHRLSQLEKDSIVRDSATNYHTRQLDLLRERVLTSPGSVGDRVISRVIDPTTEPPQRAPS